MPVERRTVSIRLVIVGVACAVVLLLGLLGAVLIGQAQDRMVLTGEQTAVGYARLVALAHGQWIAESEVALAAVGGIVERGEVANGRCTATLAALLHRARSYETFLVAGPDGGLWCAPTPIDKPLSLADRPYFKRAVQSKRFATGDYVVGRVSGVRTLPIAYPLVGGDGQISAVIIAGKRLSWFSDVIATLDLPDETHVAVVDSQGVTLAHYPGDADHDEIADSMRKWLIHATRAAEVGSHVGAGHGGQLQVHAYSPLGNLPGTGVVVSLPASLVLGAAQDFLVRASLSMAAALLLSIVLLLTVLRGVILVPLARLVAGTRAVRAGNRSWRTRNQSGGSTEMAELYQSFDSMLAELDARDQRIRAQASDLERSNTDLQNFAYSVSHDLREPLRTMGSFIRLIERRYADRLDQDGHEFMAYVTDGAERMSRMLDGVLEFSRIETRGQDFQTVDLNAVLDEVLGNLGLAIADSAAQVEGHDLPQVAGDAEQLGRVLQNLIANAIKFRKPDIPPQVSVSARPIATGWEISVADNGIGLPAEGREQLFGLFRRLVTRDQIPGDGVGLAVCKRIVERHGGSIWAESEPGQGATFRFTLPVSAAVSRP